MSVEKREALKMGNEALVRRAKRVVAEKMTGRKQADVAKELGVVSAHLYRLLKQDYLSPTLKQAMVDAGWLFINRRSPRISIQRDDPEAAAQSIVNLMDRQTALALVKAVNEHYFPFLKQLNCVINIEKREPCIELSPMEWTKEYEVEWKDE